jgi:hypothetical protein
MAGGSWFEELKAMGAGSSTLPSPFDEFAKCEYHVRGAWLGKAIRMDPADAFKRRQI